MRLLTVAVAALALAGCAAETVKLKVVVPAKTRIVGVRGVAIGGFKVENIDAAVVSAQGGGWNGRKLPQRDLDAIGDGAKADLMNALAETPYYTIVDLEGMEKLYDMNDLAGLVGKPTFKPGAVDALIFGRIWVGYLEADGIKHEKQTLEHWNYRGQQAQLLRSWEELVQSNYKTSSAVLIAQYTAVRLQPRLEVMLVTTSIQSLRQDEGGGVVVRTTRGGPLGALMALGGLGGGGRKEGKTESKGEKPGGGTVPLALEAFSWLSHEGSREFVGSISPTTTEYEIEIAKGDETSINLIKAGAYREASRRLREIVKGVKPGSVTYKEEKDRAGDLFNLGLAYEAQGPGYFQDAILHYRKSVEADPETIMYASGLGRIARLIEGTSLLELQKAERE
ncbi:MAG: hypothetical protein HYY18_08650 [Planctomycetes bacterium]|nr:hypothetical protein [Planctomycetota bacterium]